MVVLKKKKKINSKSQEGTYEFVLFQKKKNK